MNRIFQGDLEYDLPHGLKIGESPCASGFALHPVSLASRLKHDQPPCAQPWNANLGTPRFVFLNSPCVDYRRGGGVVCPAKTAGVGSMIKREPTNRSVELKQTRRGAFGAPEFEDRKNPQNKNCNFPHLYYFGTLQSNCNRSRQC